MNTIEIAICMEQVDEEIKEFCNSAMDKHGMPPELMCLALSKELARLEELKAKRYAGACITAQKSEEPEKEEAQDG